ncbi:hypothetical protein MMC14_010561, partial [Varicellaria rhodocarpa]|nr:hypothetical protein [Varicellaria rhodocarpa]
MTFQAQQMTASASMAVSKMNGLVACLHNIRKHSCNLTSEKGISSTPDHAENVTSGQTTSIAEQQDAVPHQEPFSTDKSA